MSRKVQVWWSWEGKKNIKSRFVEGISLFSQGMSLEERLQRSTRVIEEGQTAEANVTKGVSDLCVNDFHR